MNYQEYELEDQNPYIEEDPNEDERQSNGSNVRQDEELVQTILVQYERTAKQCFESGRIDQGLDSFEKAIEQLATSVENGLDSPVFHAFFEKTISYLNQLALHSLQIDHLKEAFKILDKCSQWTHPERFGIFPALRSLTFNHLGCCYRRQGKVEKAQYHLEKALSFLQALDRVDISGMTHVNLCAIFSQKGDHARALDHAKQAVADCAYDFVQSSKSNQEDDEEESPIIPKKAQMLCIAYHNLGFEEEFMSNLDGALQAYFKAYKLGEEHMGANSKLTEKFRVSYEEARDRLLKQNYRNMQNQKLISNSPPRNKFLIDNKVTVKRPPSNGRQTAVAKIYNQNNRLVVQLPRRNFSPSNNKPAQNNFMAKPNASPKYNSQKVPGQRVRPNTAHPSNRNQHYQSEKIPGGRPSFPANDQGEFERPHELHRPNDQKRPSDFPRNQIDDEDFNSDDMKMNRMAFLESLNQYQDKRVVHTDSKRKSENPTSINDPLDSENNREAKITERSDEDYTSNKGRSKKTSQNVFKYDYSKLDKQLKKKLERAVIKIQSRARGNYARSIPHHKSKTHYYFLMQGVLNKNLENLNIKDPKYQYIGMYEERGQCIYIGIKNLRTRVFYQVLIEHQPKELKNKKKMLAELREAFRNILDTVYISNGKIAFEESDVEDDKPVEEDFGDAQFDEDIEIDEDFEYDSKKRLNPLKPKSQNPNKKEHPKSAMPQRSVPIPQQKPKEQKLKVTEPDEEIEDGGFFEQELVEDIGDEAAPIKTTLSKPEPPKSVKKEEPEAPKLNKKEERELKPAAQKAQSKDDVQEEISPKKESKPLEKSPSKEIQPIKESAAKQEKPKSNNKIEEETPKKLNTQKSAEKVVEKPREPTPKKEEKVVEPEKPKTEEKAKAEEPTKKGGLGFFTKPDANKVGNALFGVLIEDKKETKPEEPKNLPKEEKKPKEEPKKLKTEEEEFAQDFEVMEEDEGDQAPPPKSSKKEVEPKQEEKVENFEEPVNDEEEFEDVEPEPPKPKDILDGVDLNAAKASAVKIQSRARGKMARKKVDLESKRVFEKPILAIREQILGHAVGIHVLEKRAKALKHKEVPNYHFFYHDYTDNKPFNVLGKPKSELDRKAITAEYVRQNITVDIKEHTIAFKPKEPPTKKSAELNQLQSPDGQKYFDYEFESSQATPEDGRSHRTLTENELLTTIPITFSQGNLNSKILYNAEKNQVVVIGEDAKKKKTTDPISIPIEQLGMRNFAKEYFLENLDYLLLAKLEYRNERLHYSQTPIPFDMQEEPVPKPQQKREKTPEPIKKSEPSVSKSNANNRYEKKKPEEEIVAETLTKESKELAAGTLKQQAKKKEDEELIEEIEEYDDNPNKKKKRQTTPEKVNQNRPHRVINMDPFGMEMSHKHTPVQNTLHQTGSPITTATQIAGKKIDIKPTVDMIDEDIDLPDSSGGQTKPQTISANPQTVLQAKPEPSKTLEKKATNDIAEVIDDSVKGTPVSNSQTRGLTPKKDKPIVPQKQEVVEKFPIKSNPPVQDTKPLQTESFKEETVPSARSGTESKRTYVEVNSNPSIKKAPTGEVLKKDEEEIPYEEEDFDNLPSSNNKRSATNVGRNMNKVPTNKSSKKIMEDMEDGIGEEFEMDQDPLGSDNEFEF